MIAIKAARTLAIFRTIYDVMLPLLVMIGIDSVIWRVLWFHLWNKW
ncbi:hypothetical protein ETAE_0890 [Edwardsiella piscicida]|uniref:Uncharacterized protein n=1 Tax=Edwardsiella piscicida TaxID=1263550 RepID=A0AAU8PI48_EDWPI|nr:hypothetical protein ETAE_0890 [Edwardsiella tarda EIB202]